MGTYNISVEGTSPLFSYTSSVAPDSARGAGGWTSHSDGSGQSYYFATKDGAVVSVEWVGTGIHLYGNTTNARYDIAIDGNTVSDYSPDAPNQLLAVISGLQQSKHKLSLTARTSSDPESQVAFTKAVFSYAAASPGSIASVQPVDDKAIAFHGQWSFKNEVSSSTNGSFHVSKNIGDQATLMFTGSGIAVSGFIDDTSGVYNTTLDGETIMYNGHSNFAQPTTLFFQTGLDASKPHNLTITNAGDHQIAVGVISVTMASGGTTAMSRHMNGGVVAGVVIASIFSILFLLFLAYYLFWRHRQLPSSPSLSSRFRRMFTRRSLSPDVESVFDDQPIMFLRNGNEKATLGVPGAVTPQSMFFPPAVLPRPPQEYNPRNSRTSTAWRDSLAFSATSDQYTTPAPAPIRKPTAPRRGSKTLLLGTKEQTTTPYLTFGRRGSRPAALQDLNRPIPEDVPGSVIDIRAEPEPSAEYSFLDISTSNGSPSGTTHQLEPSERSARVVNRGSHVSSASSGNGNGVLRGLFGRAQRLSRQSRQSQSGSGNGSGSSPSFPYPFEAQGRHGSVPDTPLSGPPSPGGSVPQTVSDIHFRPVSEITDGFRTRPTSMPAPPVPEAAPPSTAIVQRLLGLKLDGGMGMGLAPGVISPPQSATTRTMPKPVPWSRSPTSPGPENQAWPLSPIGSRTSVPQGPRPPSVVRR